MSEDHIPEAKKLPLARFAAKAARKRVAQCRLRNRTLAFTMSTEPENNPLRDLNNARNLPGVGCPRALEHADIVGTKMREHIQRLTHLLRDTNRHSSEWPSPIEVELAINRSADILSSAPHHPHCTHYAPKPADPRHAVFGELMWEMIRNLGGDFCGDEWSEEVLPLAERAGLCSRVAYDPEQHGEAIEAEPGDEIWWWGDDISNIS